MAHAGPLSVEPACLQSAQSRGPLGTFTQDGITKLKRILEGDKSEVGSQGQGSLPQPLGGRPARGLGMRGSKLPWLAPWLPRAPVVTCD